MEIKKGTVLNVDHNRKGKFKAIALQDFDTEKETFYPVALAEKKRIEGVGNFTNWVEGEAIPCRGSLCTVEIDT